MTLSVFVAVVYYNRSSFLKISFKFTDLQKVYLFTHTLTSVYRLTVHYVCEGSSLWVSIV